ncbi:MAG: TraR/DksA C4-type zinc finger protein [Paracoccaceae bacterium]
MGEVHESLPNEFQPEKFKTSKPGAYKSSSAKSNLRRTKSAQSMAAKSNRNEFTRVKHRLAKQKTREKGACLGCGKRISHFRLQAMPGTNLCVKCAQK